MLPRSSLSELIVDGSVEQISNFLSHNKGVENQRDDLGLFPIHECIDSLRFDLLPIFKQVGADMTTKTCFVPFVSFQSSLVVVFYHLSGI